MVAALLLASSPAIAADGPAGLRVTWNAPPDADPGCRDLGSLHAAVHEAMSWTPPAELLGRVEVRAALIRPAPARWQLDIHVVTPLGVTDRRVEATTCVELVDAAAVIVAVALDPLAVAATVAQAPPRPLRPTTTATATARPRELRHFGLRAAALVEAGTLPDVGAGVRLGAEYSNRLARVQLQGIWLAPRTARGAGGAAGAGVSAQLGAVAVDACVVPRVRNVEFPVCLGVELGTVRGRGIGLDAPRVAHDFWAGVTVGTGVMWQLAPWFALYAHVESVAALYRPAFRVDDLGLVYRAAPAAVRGLLGPEFRFR